MKLWTLVLIFVACGPRATPPVDTSRTLPPPEQSADLTRAKTAKDVSPAQAGSSGRETGADRR